MVDSDALQSDLINVDVGGTHFHVSRGVLSSQPNCLLDSLFSGRFRIDHQADGSVFIDRHVYIREAALLPMHAILVQGS